MTEQNQRERMKYMHGSYVSKSTDPATGATLQRYLFTSANMDQMGDTITRAATEEATERWRAWRNIRFQHLSDRPIGKAVRIGKADGLDWNAMDVRVDDPTVLPLLQGDDPVLGGASVGIIVTDHSIDENEEAVKRAAPWEPWIISGYDFVEISLVDHPANYDAKRVGTVEAGRSALLFRRRDLLDNKEDKEMTEEVTIDEEIVEEFAIEATEELAVEAAEEPAEETLEALEDIEEAPVIEEKEVEEPEESVVDPALVALGEIKGMITALGESLTTKMDAIQEFMKPVVEESVPESELEEALPMEEPIEDVEPAETETEDPLAVLSRRLEEIYAKVFGTEAEDKEVETSDFDRRVEQKVEEILQEKQKLQPRKSVVVEEEEVEKQETQSPRERLRDRVRNRFNEE